MVISVQDDPARFDDEFEIWWKPLQDLWLIGDVEWMAERQKLWDRISKNHYVQNLDKHQRQGHENIFLTGRQYRRYYTVFEDEDKYTRVSNYLRLKMIPITDPKQYTLYTEQAKYDWKYMDIASFSTCSRFYQGTGMANKIVMDIYHHIMGGGGLLDNTLLLSKDISTFEHTMETQFSNYLKYLHRFFGFNATYSHLSEEDYGWLLGLFDYYASVAEFLCDHEDKFRRRYYWEKKERKSDQHNEKMFKWTEADRRAFSLRIEDFKKAKPSGDSERDDVLEKVKDLIDSERFPEIYKEF